MESPIIILKNEPRYLKRNVLYKKVFSAGRLHPTIFTKIRACRGQMLPILLSLSVTVNSLVFMTDSLGHVCTYIVLQI